MNGDTVAITGANGFLGRAFVKQALDHGLKVLALVRSQAAAASIPDGATTAVVDLNDAHNLRRTLSECHAVVHAAGGGRMRTLDDIYRANLHTTDMLTAAIPSPETRFVFISSVAAAGPGVTDSAQLTEQPPPPRPASHYGRSKEHAERLVHERCDGISLRLPALHGPGDDRLLPLFRAAQRGFMPVVRPNLVSGFLAVEDAASLILRAIQSDVQGAYYADDGVPISRREFCHQIALAVESARPPTVITVPDSLLWTAGGINELFARVSGRSVLLTRDKVADLIHTHGHHNAARTQRDLQWSPALTLQSSLRETAMDYARRGWLR